MKNAVSAASIFALSLSLTGCMTMVTYGQATKERTRFTYAKIDEDVIRNIGYVDSEAETDKDKQMVLLGDKYSYVLKKGVEDVNLMTQLDPAYLQIPKVVYVDRGSENSISTRLTFDYKKEDESYTEQEKSILNKLCNVKETDSWKPKVYYHCNAYLSGEIYKTRNSDKKGYSLAHGRKVEIRQKGEENYKDYSELMLLPASIAIDAVTLPLQLLWVGVATIVVNSDDD